MIYELRTYTLLPGKQGEYLKLLASMQAIVLNPAPFSPMR